MLYNRRCKWRRVPQLEKLQERLPFAIEVSVSAPVVAAFTSEAEISGLGIQVADQQPVIRLLDATGVRRAIKEIDGQLYSIDGPRVYRTDVVTGAGSSFLLQPLPGRVGVEARDIAKVNGELIVVGGSRTGGGSPAQQTVPTLWHVTGTPTAIGPPGKPGIATVIHPDGIIAGFYEGQPGEFTPWIRTALGDSALPASSTPTDQQMVTAVSESGLYLSGFANASPMIWQAVGDAGDGVYELMFSPDMPLEYPQGGLADISSIGFIVEEDAYSTPFVFGQYKVALVGPLGEPLGFETHAAMWSMTGEQLYDFGADTQMLDVQRIGDTFVVAHRDSVSLLELSSVTVLELADVLPTGQTNTSAHLLPQALLLIGQPDQPALGINFAEVSQTTVNMVALVQLKQPRKVEIDVDNDGNFESVVENSGLSHSAFTPVRYGPQTLVARVTYSDGSTATAMTDYESQPFAAIDRVFGTELLLGGTTGDEDASLTKLSEQNYRAAVANAVQEFDLIDDISVDLGAGSDRLALDGGLALALNRLLNVEVIDMLNASAEQLLGVDASAVSLQVGPGGTLLVEVDAQDAVELLGEWSLAKPELINGIASASLSQEGVTLLLQSATYSNPLNPVDSNFDGFVSAIDALLIINHLNQAAGGVEPAVEAYLDVNGNGLISALDVLLVINFINNAAGEAEAHTMDGNVALRSSTSEDRGYHHSRINGRVGLEGGEGSAASDEMVPEDDAFHTERKRRSVQGQPR